MGFGAAAPSTRPLRLSMWSGPRNVSTALMYSFRQRSDAEVVDEPLYGHYLKHIAPAHPAARDLTELMDCDGPRVLRGLRERPLSGRLLYIKNMAHHMEGLGRSCLEGFRNALLTRHPREMLPSLARVMTEPPTLRDTGLARQVEILEYELEAGREPVVLDAKKLLQDPGGVLQEACRLLGLPFEESMLSWPAGPKPEDGPWAPYWYEMVHRSTGFAPYRPPEGEFPPSLTGLLEECMPYYERLIEHAIRADHS